MGCGTGPIGLCDPDSSSAAVWDEAEARRVARLAHLHLEADELRRLAGDVAAITAEFEALTTLAGDAQAPLPAGEPRADEAVPASPKEVEGIRQNLPRRDPRTNEALVPRWKL